MREIKVRAWDRAKKQMFYSEDGTNGENGFINIVTIYTGYLDSKEWGNLEITEFTGLHDCNKKEIYEGDILKWGKEGDSALAAVEYFDGAFRFTGSEIVQEDEPIGDYGHEQYGEVIGNIYENPDLLKK